MARARAKAARPAPLTPGTVFAAPVTDGRWTAYQIVSDDGASPAIVALDYLDDAAPTLEALRGVPILHVDHHSWSGRPEYLHVSPPRPPRRWRELGVLPPPRLGKCTSHGGWPDGFAQIVLQRRWDTEVPEAARAAYKASRNDRVAIDLGGLVIESARRGGELALGTGDAPIAAGTAVRWAGLDAIGHLTKLRIHGDPAGLIEHVRAHPLIEELSWLDHGRARIDLSTTRLRAFATRLRCTTPHAADPLELILPETVTELRLDGEVAAITVVQPRRGGRVRMSIAAEGGLPRGLADLRGLSLTTRGVLDLAPIVEAFPALEELSVFGTAVTVAHVERLAGLRALRTLSLRAIFRIDAAQLPPASTWPELDRVEIDGHRKVDARLLRERLGAAPRFELRGGKTDAWLAVNLDNPFRDWIDRDARTGKKAATAWRTAKKALTPPPARRAIEAVLRAFIAAFNALEAKPGLDTIDREEIGEAFFALATDAGIDGAIAERWFDAWRHF